MNSLKTPQLLQKQRLKQRRLEIKQLLIEQGLLASGIRLFPREELNVHAVADHIARVRLALQSLGPIFAAFGHYLASRVDLLALSDCLELARIPDASSPRTIKSYNELLRLRAEDSSSLAEGIERSGPSIKHFAVEPYEVRLLYQLHFGTLSNGDSVVVKVVHDDLELETDCQLLSMLEPILSAHISDDSQFASAVADFRRSIAESLDCLITAEALQTLKHDTKQFESVHVPQVYTELCSQRVLVTERLGGRRLDKLIETANQNAGPFYDGATSVNGLIPDEISRLLCDVWLYLCFEGTLMPVDLQAHNIVIRSATQIAIVDGNFSVLLASAKQNLRDYLIYSATSEPSRAMECLRKECDVSQQAISTSNLDRQFRQTVAFRDGGWADEGQANTLAESLFAHWRLFTRHSIRPLSHLVGVCRGIFQATRLARQLSPERDSLLEGVKDLRLVKMLTDFRTAFEPGYWGGQMDKVISLLMLGPKHLDDAILNASDQKETYERPRSNEEKSILKAIFVVLLLVVIYLFIKDHHVPQLISQLSTWIPALVMSICLAVLLRFISGGRKRS